MRVMEVLPKRLARCGLPAALDRAPALGAEVDARRRAAFAATVSGPPA